MFMASSGDDTACYGWLAAYPSTKKGPCCTGCREKAIPKILSRIIDGLHGGGVRVVNRGQSLLGRSDVELVAFKHCDNWKIVLWLHPNEFATSRWSIPTWSIPKDLSLSPLDSCGTFLLYTILNKWCFFQVVKVRRSCVRRFMNFYLEHRTKNCFVMWNNLWISRMTDFKTNFRD